MVIVEMVEGRVGNAVLPTDGDINGGQKSLPTLRAKACPTSNEVGGDGVQPQEFECSLQFPEK